MSNIKVVYTYLVLLFVIPVAQAEYVIKAGTMDLPPYGWETENGIAKGIIYEMTNELLVQSGLDFDHKIYPFKRMLAMMRNGKLDIFSSQGHDRALAVGEKLAVQFNINVIAVTQKSFNITRIDEFKDKKLIYHLGASYKDLDTIAGEITYVANYDNSINILIKRKNIAAAVFSEPAYYYYLDKNGYQSSDFGNVIVVEKNKEQWLFVRKDLPVAIREQLLKASLYVNTPDNYTVMLKKYGKTVD